MSPLALQGSRMFVALLTPETVFEITEADLAKRLGNGLGSEPS